ncbi:uncharacterized protein HMPREF1541_03310 [Cyphellophora europaea CBS 101466]|uniref:FAD/NAD(P)-binding domain-containing protein n=1 Tax=Cyphellophora europaea (strain CBS 101466) TaxID=1220924 RepID=W2RYI8_CYPE1|nr:uncharacterized protein HMPREF1541_03310 [Cyphellophora europaea CBS 101466]ETN41375.1 hypothetical protein HMPREF1541_03310 [Cyphellophora europaea CBS 101466]
MAIDFLRILILYARHAFPYLLRLARQKLLAVHHRYTYRPTEKPLNVVVIGASFGGLHVAQRLAETLPTGYRVVLIERNSHLNYVFAFPRFSVVSGYEERAFVPYDCIAKDAPEGVFERKHAEVARVTSEQVVLESGECVHYAMLVVATGCSQPRPARLRSRDSNGGCQELRNLQGKVKEAGRIAVVGGGAVGVELAADIKSYYPDKAVTLVHSRQQLLNSFGPGLHKHTMEALEKLGLKIKLGERPAISDAGNEEKKGTLTFSDGNEEEFDLIVPCTGQRPNASILAELAPASSSKQTSRIMVKPTLQISDHDDTTPYPNIFALGDVAETGGPKMARATMMQGEVVVNNVLNMIKHGKASATYTPQPEIEGAIKLTLGIRDFVMYTQDSMGSELLFSGSNGSEDIDAAKGWAWYGPGAKAMPKRRITEIDE